jgi:hypothetical protein
MVMLCHRGPRGAIVRGLTKGPYSGPLDTRFVLRPTA